MPRNAGAASAIVAVFGNRGKDVAPTEVEVVIAANDMAAMTVVKGEMLETKKISSSQAPEQFLTNPVQVVGRVLSVPVTKGQAVTRACFSADGSGVQLASALEEGMRAVSVSLTDYSGLYGLLYPGSMVDVMAYLKVGGNTQESASVTILKAVQVLGVEDQTVVSVARDEDLKSPEGGRGSGKRWMITLMVDPKDAQALQLAMENGRITLAMRNPLDGTGEGRTKPTYLGDLLPRSRANSRQPAWGQAFAKQIGSALSVWAKKQKTLPRSKSTSWEMEIFRGGESQIVSFPHSEK